MRLSAMDNHGVLEKFATTFDQYWSDRVQFEAYERQRFNETTTRRSAELDALAQAVALRPQPHQQVALDALTAEGAHGHWRNLVVAATGTGKTIVAALDYARLRAQLGGDPSLLFVAHTAEILKQSQARYRAATRDGNFGELLVGGERLKAGRHVFASIQALHGQRLEGLRPDAYDVVVIDEFHHAAAPSYEALLSHLRPKVLLGLTATPERSDGASVLHWFDHRIAAELRLWDALDQNLLCPFQYFGVHDGTDLSMLDFRNGRYDRERLSSLYTGDHARALAVLRAVERHLARPDQMRALGFCVSVAHARFMAEFFSSHGLRAAAVDGETPEHQRRASLEALRRGELTTLFSVNLFNEGLDVPSVDTVLLLRPTESATVFLQQLGRGLRQEPGKSCLTVLDFIGTAHQRFRFVDRFRALTRGTRAQVERAIEDGFPQLPAGCEIQLDAQSQRIVLENVRGSLLNRRVAQAEDLRALGDVPLSEFLTHAQLELEELYAKRGRTFAELRHLAGFEAQTPDDSRLVNAISALTFIDDDLRLQAFARWLAGSTPPVLSLEEPLVRMFHVALGQSTERIQTLGRTLALLWKSPALLSELRAVLEVLIDRQRRPTFALQGSAFQVHASYSRDEVAAGLGELRKGKLLRTQSGVLRSEAGRCDVFFVELDKDPAHYTPTTLYDDRPLSPELFQWESQSVTRADSETGRRYRSPPPGWRTFLFVRQQKTDSRGLTSPYVFLGPVHYLSHQGERPMRIVWRLERPMPPAFFADVKIAAG